MIFIGIDNGISGGLVALGECGSYIEGIAMPCKKWRSRNEVDIRKIHLWLSEVSGGNLSNAIYTIEEPNNSRTPSTAYSVASSFHSFRGFFEAKFLSINRITPQSWQKSILGKVPKGDTKKYALTKAVEIWPEENFLASNKSRVPHTGITDAALIAYYGMKLEENLTKNTWKTS